MDALRLASGMGMGMGMEAVSGALQSARDSASATVAAGSAAAAAGITSSVDSLKKTSMADVSSGVLSATSTLQASASAGLSTAAKTARATSDVLATSAAATISSSVSTISDPRATLSSVSTTLSSSSITSIGASAWAGTCAAGSADGPPGRGARSADEEDSQSGGEEGGKQAPSAWMGVASRLGLGSKRETEKEQLVPKDETELEEGRRRSFGAMPSSLSGSLGSLGSYVPSSLGSAMGIEKAKEPESRCARQCRCCPALSYQQRMLGFVITFALGGLLSLSALSSIGAIFLGNPAPFAVKYTLGNLLSISASSFLVGPAKQCRDMFSPERAAASLIYWATLLGTLLCVFVLKVQLLSLVCVIAQFAALTWYMLSYIPYGQQCAKRLAGRFL